MKLQLLHLFTNNECEQGQERGEQRWVWGQMTEGNAAATAAVIMMAATTGGTAAAGQGWELEHREQWEQEHRWLQE